MRGLRLPWSARLLALLPLAGLLAGPAAQSGVRTSASAGRLTLENGNVQAVLTREGESIAKSYYARTAAGMRLLLRSGSAALQDPSLVSDGRTQPARFTRMRLLERSGTGGAAAELEATSGGHRVTRLIELQGDDPFFRVRVADTLAAPEAVSSLRSVYSFVPGLRARPDFVWTPQLRPESTDVIGDHTFRSPALMLQRGELFAALIPDVEALAHDRRMPTAADLQVRGAPMLSYGAVTWRPRAHVYYRHADTMAVTLAGLSYGYYLYLDGRARPGEGYREVVRFHWEREGAPRFAAGTGPQAEPFSSYEEKAWKRFVPMVALDTLYRGVPVTLLRQGRLAWSNKLPPAADNDSWFTVWFNSLRVRIRI